jgi:hypothetical protein
MKILEQWRRVRATISRLDDSGSAILNTLEPLDEVRRGSSKKSVAIINVAHHIRVHELAGGVLSDEAPDLTNSIEMEERFLTNVLYLVGHVQVVINHNSKIASGR